MLAHGIKFTLCGIPMYLGIWAIIGSKIERNDACFFQETEHL